MLIIDKDRIILLVFREKEEAKLGAGKFVLVGVIVDFDLSDYFEIILAGSLPKRGNSKRIFKGLEGRSDGGGRVRTPLRDRM